MSEIQIEQTDQSIKVNIVLDATMLDTFDLCPARFNFAFNMNKTLPIKPKQLDRGTLIHIGMENYYLGLKDKLSFDACQDSMINAVNIASETDSDLPSNEISRIKEVLLETTKVYRTLDERMEILAVETAFSYVLHEDDLVRIIMIGKIDLLANYHDQRNQTFLNTPFDHKSYERDNEISRMTNQFCNYSYATGSNYLIVNRIGMQTSIKPEIKHKRIPLSYDNLFLQQWKDNVIKICYDYLNCAASNSWPMRWTSCDKYNRRCEFYPVCDSSGAEAKFWKLNANYDVREPWDVSKALSGKKE